jgi:hypothetical protein
MLWVAKREFRLKAFAGLGVLILLAVLMLSPF